MFVFYAWNKICENRMILPKFMTRVGNGNEPYVMKYLIKIPEFMVIT